MKERRLICTRWSGSVAVLGSPASFLVGIVTKGVSPGWVVSPLQDSWLVGLPPHRHARVSVCLEPTLETSSPYQERVPDGIALQGRWNSQAPSSRPLPYHSILHHATRCGLIVAWLTLKVKRATSKGCVARAPVRPGRRKPSGTLAHKDTGGCQLTSAQSCGCPRSAAPASPSALERTGTWSCIPLGVSPGRSPRFQLCNGRHDAGQEVFQFGLFAHSLATNMWSSAVYWTQVDKRLKTYIQTGSGFGDFVRLMGSGKKIKPHASGSQFKKIMPGTVKYILTERKKSVFIVGHL